MPAAPVPDSPAPALPGSCSSITLAPLACVAPRAVETLLDAAFGRDRHLRTAYRVRGDAAAIAALSFAALDGDALVGSIQCWPVALSRDSGASVALTMLGPVAVDPARQQGGIGRRLVEATLAAAGDAPMMLIGDPEYYGRFFGFTAAATAQWRLPGPVERHRLLARGTGVPDGPGLLGPAG